MSKERELLRLLIRVKVLLECSNVEPLQRHSDLIVGEIKELLAQPEQEGVYQKLSRIEDGIEVEILPSELWLDGYETGKRSMQPEQEHKTCSLSFLKGYARGFDVARKDYKQKVINAFGSE